MSEERGISGEVREAIRMAYDALIFQAAEEKRSGRSGGAAHLDAAATLRDAFPSAFTEEEPNDG